MASAPSPYSFRRSFGRAASPPTWACYEQVQYDSASDSCSEDDEDYHSSPDDHDHSTDDDDVRPPSADQGNGAHDIESMDIDVPQPPDSQSPPKLSADVKGKARAVEPVREPTKKKPRKSKEHVITLRPILTIQRSQGFVWNQACIFSSISFFPFLIFFFP
jgi:hypothetical protein